jgi:hypothetical protein
LASAAPRYEANANCHELIAKSGFFLHPWIFPKKDQQKIDGVGDAVGDDGDRQASITSQINDSK